MHFIAKTMVYVAWFAFGLMALRFFVALFNMVTQPYLSRGRSADEPLVSVLIPARNEAENISNLLQSLARLEYGNLEVLVYDDDSTDGTAQIVSDYKMVYPLRVIRGSTLPQGWLGKSHACHSLAAEAKGEYLLFLDADVTVQSDMIGRLVSFMRRKRLALISIFPFQVMISRGERLVVPVMHWILVSFLPLLLVRVTRNISLSAANGQLMFFDAKSYRDHQWHRQVKHVRVEDIAIARLVKGARLRMATLLSKGEVRCRMYSNYRQAVTGLSRSVCAFFGESYMAMLLFSLLSTIGLPLVAIFLPSPLWVVYLFFILMVRAVVSIAAEQSLLFNVYTIIVQHYAFLQIVVKALINKLKGRTEWKGRNLSA